MQKTTLDNGMTVILDPHHFAPVVATQIWVGVGSADESPEEAGLAHFHEHMLFKGTMTRGVGEIARDIEGLGGNINAWTSFDQTVYHTVLPSESCEEGLAILADAISNSIFDPDEVEKESEVILEELKRSQDMPWSRLSQELFAQVFQQHPYRRPIIGTADTIKSFEREDLLRFYRKWYVPNNLTLVMVGDFDEAKVMAQVKELFAAQNTQKLNRHRDDEPAQTSLRTSTMHEEIQESYIQLGFHAPGLGHEDVYALKLLASILGQGDSSRLEERLQREKQVLNGFSCSVYSPRDRGLFLLGLSTAPGREEEALEGVLSELALFHHELPQQHELDKTKTFVKSTPIFLRETMQGIAQTLGHYQVVAGDLSYEEEFYSGMARVTIDDIRRVAREYLHPDKMTVVAMTPKEGEGANFQLEAESLHQNFTQLLRPSKGTEDEEEEGELQKFTLSNGVRVLLKESRRAPLVSVRAAVFGGTRYETDDTNGIGNLIARLLTQGTRQRSASSLAKVLDHMASSISGFSGRNSLGLSGTFLSEHFDRGLDLFLECLLTPSFDKEEVERERWMVMQDLRSQEDDQARMTFQLFNRTLYKEHPYRLPILGNAESVEALTPEGMREYYHSLLRPEQLVLCAVGDFDSQEVLTQLEYVLSSLEPKESSAPEIVEEAAPFSKREARRFKDKQQAHLVLGFRGTTLDSREKYTFEVLNAVLSGQGGRLFLELRDEQSLAYSVSSFSVELLERGYFAVYIGTSPSKVEQAIEGILSELRRLQTELVGEEELERNKRYLTGNHAISLQRHRGLAMAYALNELYGLDPERIELYPSRIHAVTAEDIQALAKKYFLLDRYTLAITQPEEEAAS